MSTALAPAPPRYRCYPAVVVGTRRVGASLVRVTLGDDGLAGFAGGGRDQSVSLFLPHPGQLEPVLPPETEEDWFTAWRAMDPAVRAVMRSYTIREHRPERTEVDIDLVRHGDTGPASRWAGRTGPGDRVVVLGPAVQDERTVRFRPPADTDGVLLVADETALPAVERILAWLPAGTRARVLVEAPDPADLRPLPTAAEVEVTWVFRAGRRVALLPALRAVDLPTTTPYAWVAGEAGMVRAVRRQLVGERGLNRRQVTFAGYWRRGLSEEEMRAAGD
ncbi:MULTISPECIES: siderophore-interacting protein [Micromonospora]|uniref:NADPH-dependent ferric siderophore reductase n=1 Tax=Micromonospora sicca TaxID=2202420 RepID=A0A317DCM3_9ACTN|nr:MULTISPECIES: siderophore-interacting protein [unclassified Micromonospora]MBM0224984.1 siderophore-interacting protein [Micromonospora sp. ATA51]PWR12224.1 NADPH-dependent ferric siderophore reductase [Micromonospora sp. 4G51]